MWQADAPSKLEEANPHETIYQLTERFKRENNGKTLTLMKPPSGFARLNRGCLVVLGCSSLGDLIFLNSGTVLIAGGFWRRGALESLKAPSSAATADEG